MLHRGKIFEEFDVQSGVQQGGIRGCLGLKRASTFFLKHIAYPDDTCLLSHEFCNLAKSSHKLKSRVGKESSGTPGAFVILKSIDGSSMTTRIYSVTILSSANILEIPSSSMDCIF